MIQQLKENIELKFGRKISYHKDCRALSECIISETSHLLSSSTLRRFFGLLATNSNPSRVTLDILSTYCGYNSWDDFQLQNSHTIQYPDSIPSIWETAKQRAKVISKKNVRQLKKGGVTEMLANVQREFVNELLTELFSSTFHGIPIIAPGGYGKTALLINCYNDYNQLPNTKNDIVLLIPATFLENWVGKDFFIENWLLTLLDISSTALFDRVKEKLENIPGKFILLIDALDQLTISSNKSGKIFEAINLFINNLPSKGFKVIVTSRYPAWVQFTKASSSLDSWCRMSSNLFNSYGSNIPSLTFKEIQKVLDETVNCKGQTRLTIEQLPQNLQQELKYPYNLNLYINTNQPTNKNKISSKDDLIAEFVKNKVYQKQFSDEKADILDAIVSISHKGKLVGIIKKNELKALYPIHLKLSGNYFSAYNQLLSFGILGEQLIENEYGLYTKKVYITHRPLYELLLVQMFIKENDGISIKLFKLIEEDYKNSDLLGNLIVLLYNITYKMGLTSVLKQIFSLSDHTLKQVFADNTMLQIINSNEQTKNELILHYVTEPTAQKYLFEQFNDLNSIASSSRMLPICYLKQSKEETGQLFAKTLISLSDAYRLNFKWTNDFVQATKNDDPPTEFNSFTKGTWFACLLVANYIDKTDLLNDVADKISSFTKVNYSNGIANRPVFELSLVFGMLFTKQHQHTYKRLEIYLGNRLKNPQTAEEHALAIYCIYAKWRSTGKFEHDKMQKIEGYLTKVPEWIQIQTVIIGKGLMAVYSFTIGNMEIAYSLYRDALELSNFAGYKIFEIKLLKELSETLITIGEHQNAKRCDQLIESIAQSSNIDFRLI
ncbi:MAG TPA: hypothetical protein DG754_04730 [Bacteroidales bacterium]|jgi:KaiC/GvpD/RAD55 family RecA-like ATPase|nr:hypothetical protein [Bacteroidales bacterium]